MIQEARFMICYIYDEDQNLIALEGATDAEIDNASKPTTCLEM